jgi:cytochrome c5
MSKSRTPKARSGGGITSNKNVRVGQKLNPRSVDVISLAATSMLGQQVSSKRPEIIKRQAQDFAPMGNALTNNCGPNAEGRTVYARGTQNTHGSTAPGQKGMEGKADRGPRAILDEPPRHNSPGPGPKVFRRGEQVNE